MRDTTLSDEARKKIEDHLTANDGAAPDFYPQTKQVHPWRRGHPDRKIR